MRKIFLILIALLMIYPSCSQDKRYNRNKALKMLDEANSEIRIHFDSLVYHRAMKKVEKAIKYDSTFVSAYLLKTLMLEHMGHYDSAVVFINKFFTRFTSDISYNIARGKVLLIVKKDSAANESFKQALKLIGSPTTYDQITTFVQLKFVLYGKETALKELNSYKSKLTDFEFNFMHDMLENTTPQETF